FSSVWREPRSSPFPYTTLFRSSRVEIAQIQWFLHVRRQTGRTEEKKITRRGNGARDFFRVELRGWNAVVVVVCIHGQREAQLSRSEEHTSELQSRSDLVCRLLL